MARRKTSKAPKRPARIAQQPIADAGGVASGYVELLEQLKNRIRDAQGRAGLAVNRELIMLYRDLGNEIWKRQRSEGWGARVVDRLSADLRREFPAMRGLSARNLQYARTFAEAWPDDPITQQLVAQLPWGHHTVLLDKLEKPAQREWYARAAAERGWSRATLQEQIRARFHLAKGKAPTNFHRTLPSPQSTLAREALKDPYNFDFLGLGDEAHERVIETALVDHVRDFLLELGVGFAFIGRQVPLRVGDNEFFVDLLFYHARLHCYVVVELKATEFRPEYAGQLNFYLSATDDLVRQQDDNPSIGLLLCKSKNDVVVEYALKDVNKPISVSRYILTGDLPKEFQGKLPTIEELEAELQPRRKR